MNSIVEMCSVQPKKEHNFQSIYQNAVVVRLYIYDDDDVHLLSVQAA